MHPDFKFKFLGKFVNFGDLKFGKKSLVTLKNKKKNPINLKQRNGNKEKPLLDIPPRNEKKPKIIENKIEVILYS